MGPCRELDDRRWFHHVLEGTQGQAAVCLGHFERRWSEGSHRPGGNSKSQALCLQHLREGSANWGGGSIEDSGGRRRAGSGPRVDTNSTDLASAKVVHLLKMRWRRETASSIIRALWSRATDPVRRHLPSEEERLVEKRRQGEAEEKNRRVAGRDCFQGNMNWDRPWNSTIRRCEEPPGV